MKRILTQKMLREGDLLPRWYGSAWRDSSIRAEVCYPIPLHWLVRWARGLYYFAAFSRRRDAIEQAYERGREEGIQIEQRRADIVFISRFSEELERRAGLIREGRA